MINQLNFENKNQIKKVEEFLQKNSSFEYLQSVEWNKIRTEKNKFFLFFEEAGEIVWSCSLFEKQIDGEVIVYAPRGPVLDYENKEQLKCFFENISVWCKSHGYQKLVMNPVIFEKQLKNFPKNLNFSVKNATDFANLLESPKLALMNVDASEEVLFSKLSARTRRSVRKAYKNSLELKVSKNINLDEFLRLYGETSQRHGFHAHDRAYFEKILNTFENVVCFEVWHEGVAVAMAIDLIYEGKLVYAYGASSSKHRELASMFFLHFEAIKYAVNKNIPVYDFGGVFCTDENTESKDFGLYSFKKGFCYDGFTDIVPDIWISF